jgi:hypothetical protein
MFNFSSDPYIAENQMRAIIYHLMAFAYIDADFNPAERRFIRSHIARLVEERARAVSGRQAVSPEVLAKWTKHFHEVQEEIDHRIQGYFHEPVAHGETNEQFVLARLKLGCFELLKRLDEQGQQAILEAVEQLMLADGVIHPNEQTFHDEIARLITSAEEVDEVEIQLLDEGEVIIGQTQHPLPAMENHPFLSRQEWDFSRDPVAFDQESRGDMVLVDRVRKVLDEQRLAGQGKLGAADKLSAFPPGAQFLDGHVWVLSPLTAVDHELLVLGDLHGCYSCLKAALLQVDFFAKAQAHADDPGQHPPIYLVFLGDYIDRGRFSLSGTLRTAMQLFVQMPQHVFILRGNHEYFVDLDGRILAPVRPCEAMDSISAVAKNEVLATYMHLFEALPNMLAFGDLFFVHGGIPRADTLEASFSSLASLNDDELRFQMMWSDPSEADVIPLELQQASARFPFGKRQFLQFMSRLGCKVMVRGHEQIDEGFRLVYDEPSAKLATLFSAGGAQNNDLPSDSSYRQVRPMALTIRYCSGVSTLTPFEIDYARFNDPRTNAFFKEKLGG